jgi:16S rRNA (adenine1518-N6/adenine1519-N6)-dimethyltransferase
LVRPKKSLGQHFLIDDSVIQKLVNALTGHGNYTNVLEVGPGTGVMTKYLLETDRTIHAIEMDRESIPYLKQHYPDLTPRLIEGDFLKLDLNQIVDGSLAIIGNFPYYISTQIFFRVLEEREKVPEMVGMVQKEVGQRIAAPPGSKTYGILSVLVQTYYDVEMLFIVPPEAFNPPPKIDSAVIRFRRNDRAEIPCGYAKLKMVVKLAFNQRRKTLRNALKSLTFSTNPEEGILAKRAEQLSVDQFIALTCCVDSTS